MEEKLDIDIIAVGGIMTPNQAVDRLLIGERVKAVQLFSGIIKNGFSLIPETLEAIANISV
jgi:dihydroorotate dehydrogenase